jgi:hypothetical protein
LSRHTAVDLQEEPGMERRWDILALLVLLLTSLFFQRAMLGEDWTVMAPVAHARDSVSKPGAYPGSDLARTDQAFVAWLVARNARALLHDPLTIYDAETCFPAERSLALGEPGLSLGVLGIPFRLLTDDPIAIYNGVLLLLPLLSGLAFYWVMKRWTGVPAAALAGALFYAFHALKVHDPVHFFVYDSVWTVLALYFAERMFSQGRVRDAVLLWSVTTMQLAGSLYPTIAAALVGLPFILWLALSRRPSRRVLILAGAVGVGMLLSGAVLFAPFFAHAGEGTLAARELQVFRPLEFLLPNQGGFPGLTALGFIGAAFWFPWTRMVPGLERDPRWVLLGAVVLIEGISIGVLHGDFTVPVIWTPEQGPAPNLYMALAQWVPGLGVVRAPAAIFNNAVPLIGMLLSMGAAAALRSLPEGRRLYAAAGLVLLVGIDTLRPPGLGLSPEFVFSAFRLRPAEAELDLYATLEDRGNAGPLVEVPVSPRRPTRESGATLLTAYHGRRSGQCYNSYHTPEVQQVRAQVDALPSAKALHSLAEMGFTTLIVKYPPMDQGSGARRKAFEARASEPSPLIAEVYRRRYVTAYEIVRPVGE